MRQGEADDHRAQLSVEALPIDYHDVARLSAWLSDAQPLDPLYRGTLDLEGLRQQTGRT
ncbi:MAG: hypothetical protein IRZ33_10835 [Alicyclobacillaceae bacterium]|nr:hypothetical protein [Alicyclobacillaceae bacterium]